MNNETEFIGPRKGQETALMLAGEKPLALFSGFADDTGNFPDPDFEPHVRGGTLVKREFCHPKRACRPSGTYCWRARRRHGG
jgi:hypothetical protein